MECLQIFRHHPAWLVPSQPRLHVWSWFCLGPCIPPWPMVLSCPLDLLSSVSHSWPVWTDWGQSVLKVGRRCIATLQLWVGNQPISSSHTLYPAYMCSASCLPLATLNPSHPRIPVAHPVHPTWLTVQPVVLSGPRIHCQTDHSARTPCMMAHHQGYRP